MQEVERIHKDVTWGWVGALVAGWRTERAGKPASSVRRRRVKTRIQAPWGRHVAHYG